MTNSNQRKALHERIAKFPMDDEFTGLMCEMLDIIDANEKRIAKLEKEKPIQYVMNHMGNP